MPSVEEGVQPEMLIDTAASGPTADGAASAAAETRSEATEARATAADASAAAVEAGTTVAEAGASAEAGAAIEDAATQSGISAEVVTTAEAGASAEGIAAAKAGTTVAEAGASEASEPGAAIEVTAAQADASAEADAVAKVAVPAEADAAPKAVAAANDGAGDTGSAVKASTVNVFFSDFADEVVTIDEGCESPRKEPGQEEASPKRVVRKIGSYRMTDVGRAMMTYDGEEEVMDLAGDCVEDGKQEPEKSYEADAVQGSTSAGPPSATGSSQLKAKDEPLMAEFKEPEVAVPRRTSVQDDGHSPRSRPTPNRPSFSRESFTQLRAPKPQLDNGRISFQGFQSPVGGIFVSGTAIGALSEAPALKRISFSQLRKESDGYGDFGLDRNPSAGNEGARPGRGSFSDWRSSTLNSSMQGERATTAFVGAGTGDADDSELPLRGTWQGRPSAPLIVRSALKRNTLRSLQQEKNVGQSSLAEKDSNLFANLPSICNQAKVTDPSTLSALSSPPVASPWAAGAKVQAGDDGGEAAPAAEADAASGQGRPSSKMVSTASGDWDFLQEMTKVVQEDLECESPKVASPSYLSRGITKDASPQQLKPLTQQASTTSWPVGTFDAQRLLQDLQRMKDLQEVEAANSKQLIDRLAVLEAENKRLKDLAQGAEKELSLARQELEILREQNK